MQVFTVKQRVQTNLTCREKSIVVLLPLLKDSAKIAYYVFSLIKGQIASDTKNKTSNFHQNQIFSYESGIGTLEITRVDGALLECSLALQNRKTSEDFE